MKYLYFFNKIKNIALSNKKAKSNDLSALKRNLFVSNRQKNNRSADTDITQTLERGRSMIEMLGVLVIMGLLAVGGIWGYQYAMGIYRAGQIQDVMAQAKALTVTKRTASQNSLSSFLDKTATAGLNPAVNIVETPDASGRTIRIYTITLNNVDEQVQRFAYARKPNFAKMDIMLAPSADAVEETDQSKESWVDAGMSEGEYDILQQYTFLQSGKSLLFAFTTRSRRGITGGSDGDGENAPTECPADMPFYDEATDSCSRCDVSLNEYWDPTQMKCIACTEPQDYWDETNYACSCPPSIPVYDSATNTCVECLVDTDCKDEANPVCNAEHKCEPCPEGQFYNGTQCMLNCEDKKIWDREQQTCVCNPAYYETDANGYCVCKTDETVETSIKSKGLNASSYGCKLHIQDLGRLKGTYYFKWISGVHIYSIASQTSTPNGVRLHAGTAETGKVTDTEIGAIFNVDMSPCPNYPAGVSTSYRASCLKKQLALTKPKYFSFDGTKMISLWFYDSGTCSDNSGTMTVELRKVISSCPEAGGSSGGGSSDVECTTNADCNDSSKPICNASHICEACPNETPHWNGTACISCSDTTPIWNAETKECEVCPEQTPHWNGTTCIACSDSKPVWNAETKECEACPDQTPHWNGTTCIACSDSKPIWNAEIKECEACPEQTPHWNGTACIACSDTTPIWNAETKECEACPEQTPHWNGTACIACSDSKPIWNAEIKECEACPNNTPYWNGTTCIDCSDSAPVWNSVTQACETCPPETPHWNGATCIACSDDTPIWNSSTKTCDTCPSDTPYWNGNACIACSDDTPLWNSAERVCEACPYPTPVWNGTACEECPESKPAWDGNQCETCPANTPYWNESEMDCESCPIETPHWDGIACVVCPDGTQWDGTSCVPNSCAEKLVNAGVDSSTFTVDPNDPTRIIVPGALYLSGDIDLSECSLFVGDFRYRGAYTTLKVKNLISKGQIYMSEEESHIIVENDVIAKSLINGICDIGCGITANRFIGGKLGSTVAAMVSDQIYYCEGYYLSTCQNRWQYITEDTNTTSSKTVNTASPSAFPGLPNVCPYPTSKYGSLPKKLEVCHMLCYDDTPRWNSETRECEACPAETPHWNGTECIACSDSKPVWNAKTKECEACPSETPVWNGTRCVECVADSDCASNTDGRTICDTDTNTCQEPEMMCPIGDYYEYATEAEAQWCVENCPEHFKKGNTCYSCYYMQHVAFPTHEEAQTCADSCKEIRGAKYETCTLCTDTYYRYWNVNNAEECTDICPGMRFANVYTPENDGGTIPPIFVNYNNCDSCYLSGLHGSMAQFDIEDCSKICLNHVQVGSECISCDVTEGLDGEVITFESEALAQECAEKCNGKRYASGKDCISCLPATTISTDEEAAECLKNCPNKFVTGNYCYSCDYGKHIHYTEKITFANNDEAQECASNCPEERFAHGSTCYSCYNIATYSFSTEEEAQACGKACGKKRHVEGNKCHFNLVPAMQTQTLIGGEETVPPLSE